MPTDAGELTCVRCGLEVRVNRESYEIFERTHWVCLHFAFEHGGFDPDEECDAPGCPSSPSSSPAAAPCGLLASDPAFQKLDTAELLAMVPRPAESILLRGRAAMELGRRAAGDEQTTALARELATEWPPADQADFARLMTSSGVAWPPSA